MATAFTNAQVVAACGQPVTRKIDAAGSNCLFVYEQNINFDAIATSTGTALAHSDTYQALNIKKGDIVLDAGIIILSAATGAADIDFGMVSGTVDAFANDLQANAVNSAGNFGTAGQGQSMYFAAADTLDIDEESAAATLAGCVVKAWALVLRINNDI